MPSDTQVPQLAVPVYISKLLVALAEGWAPAPLGLNPIKLLSYGGIDVSDLVQRVWLGSDRLCACLGGSRFHDRARELFPISLDRSLEATCEDGTTIHADSSSRVSHGSEFTIEMGAWVILSSEAPSLWIGEIEGATYFPSGGNLIVERESPDGLHAGRKGHFRFAGKYTYYLIQLGDSAAPTWRLVIDTASGVPNAEVLASEFLLLQFVFGRQLRILSLLGVTEDLVTTGSTSGVGTRANLNRNSKPPVPIYRNNKDRVDECWVALLFDRICEAWAARPEISLSYLMAFDSYLDALSNHLSADYLRLHVALEAFAYWAHRHVGEQERLIVSDKKAWKQWVYDHAEAIRAFASPGFEESLLNKVRGVYRLASGRVVPSAFSLYGLQLTPEMIGELEGRDIVVHQGTMAPEGVDVLRDVRRIDMVRSLVVALAGKSVNYEGAIAGWDLGWAGYPIEPQAWWVVRREDRRAATRTFIARTLG